MTSKKDLPDNHRKEIAVLAMMPELANNRAMLWYQDEPDEVPQIMELMMHLTLLKQHFLIWTRMVTLIYLF